MISTHLGFFLQIFDGGGAKFVVDNTIWGEEALRKFPLKPKELPKANGTNVGVSYTK